VAEAGDNIEALRKAMIVRYDLAIQS